MQHPASPGKAHGGKSVILRNHNIACGGPIDQSKIHTVSAFVNHQCFRTVPMKYMGSIAQNKARDVIFAADPECNIHHGTSVSIDQYPDNDHLRQPL